MSWLGSHALVTSVAWVLACATAACDGGAAPPSATPPDTDAGSAPGADPDAGEQVTGELVRFDLGDLGHLGAVEPVVTINSGGPIESGRSAGTDAPGDGSPLSIGGTAYKSGLGVHATSELVFRLGGRCSLLHATAGVDDNAGDAASVTFEIWTDGTRWLETPIMRRGDAPQAIEMHVDGADEVRLVVTDGRDGPEGDLADWIEPYFLCAESPRGPDRPHPTWQMLGLLVRRTDAAFAETRLTTTMTPAEEAGAIAAARTVPDLIRTWSGDRAFARMDIVAVDAPLMSLSPYGDTDFWAAPSDVEALLDEQAPRGAYDSIFLMWDPDGDVRVPLCCFLGMGRGDTQNGATYASIAVFADGPWRGTYPGEAFVHEWLHGSTSYYREERGFAVPDPHENDTYGYPTADAGGSWWRWYTALLSGTLVAADGSTRGFTDEVWAAGTPTSPSGGSPFGPPEDVRATPDAAVSAVRIEWSANALADHYRIFRGTAPGEEEYIGWTSETSYVDGGLSPGRYFYVVRSVRPGGGVESETSAEVMVDL